MACDHMRAEGRAEAIFESHRLKGDYEQRFGELLKKELIAWTSASQFASVFPSRAEWPKERAGIGKMDNQSVPKNERSAP